jgi:hypothetical protein
MVIHRTSPIYRVLLPKGLSSQRWIEMQSTYQILRDPRLNAGHGDMSLYCFILQQTQAFFGAQWNAASSEIP